MCIDALQRNESCGGHYRVESQTPEGEARRDDENFSYVAAWEWTGAGQGAGAPQGTADFRVRSPDAAELQVIMNLTLKIWRQKDANAPGKFVTYEAKGVTTDMSFLEMLDILNEELIGRGEDPVAFDHDCREGICGSCGFLINGAAHGPRRGTTVCQLHMRFFKDGDSLTLEPWRAKAFPIVKDLVVDRSCVRPDHPGRRLHLRSHRRRARTQASCWFQRKPPRRPWTPPPASAVRPAWPPARTLRPCSSPRPRRRT